MGAVLLVETDQGSYVAVRFSTVEEARDWGGEHAVPTIGAVPVVSPQEALAACTAPRS